MGQAHALGTFDSQPAARVSRDLPTALAVSMGLDSVELVMSVEEEFDIQIPDSVAGNIVTVGQLHNYVSTELQRLGREQQSDAVFKKIQQITCEQLGIKPERVTLNARFIQDLGLS